MDDCEPEAEELLISPIPTPVVYRPETRESERMSAEDRRTQMLQGFVNRLCPPDEKVVKLYLASGFVGNVI